MLFGIIFLIVFICCMRTSEGCFSNRPRVNERFCTGSGDELYTGDFDGDTYVDILCFNRNSGKKQIKYSLSQPFGDPFWESNTRWCTANDDVIYVGDFNGDGRKDLLCHHRISGWKTFNYANQQGEFTGNSDFYKDMRFCYHAGSSLHVADFNNDGRDDMICSDTTGRIWIAYANSAGQFHAASIYKQLDGCRGGERFIGDFNGDGTSDVLCFNPDNRVKKIYIIKKNGIEKDFDNSLRNGRWCGKTQFIRTGDFNGDGLTDILCHNKANDYYWGILNKKNMYFDERRNSFSGRFCHVSSSSRYLYGDFNGDGKHDMICLNHRGWFEVSTSTCN